MSSRLVHIIQVNSLTGTPSDTVGQAAPAGTSLYVDVDAAKHSV